MKTELIDKIFDLRNAVAYLGEKKSWWNSNFYDDSSRDFLTYVFPKSNNLQFNGSAISTRHFMDSEVGATYHHLFRLPMSIEELISKKARGSTLITPESEEMALSVLEDLANGLTTDRKSGPKNIGSTDDLNDEIIQVFAAEYLDAFKVNYIVHPYLN